MGALGAVSGDPGEVAVQFSTKQQTVGRRAPRALGQHLRRMIAASLATTMLATTLAPAPVVAADLGPGKVLAGGLDSFAAALVAVAGSDVLLEPLPLTTRSTADLLSIERTLVGSLRAGLVEVSDDAGLDDVVAAVGGASATVGASKGTFSLVLDDPVEGAARTMTLGVEITTSQQVPILYRQVQLVDEVGDVVTDPAALIEAQGDEAIINEDTIVALTGTMDDAVTVQASFATTIPFRFDPDAPVGDQLATVGEPQIAIDVAGTGRDLSLSGAYGFADIEVTGSVAYDLDIGGTAADPDEVGGIRRAEWERTLPAELVPLTRVDTAEGDDVDVALSLDSPQINAEDGDGRLTWRVEDSSGGLGEPELLPSQDLALFRNVTPADALVAATHLATAVGTLHTEGDVEVPFTDSKLSRAFSPATVLQTVIQQFAVADIRCGRSNTSPPLGDDGTGKNWYCQAYTAEDPDAGSVSWTVIGDEDVVVSTADTTVGEVPTANVTFTDVDQPPDLRVSWKVTGDDGRVETHTARSRPRTAGELRAALEGGISDVLPSNEASDVTVTLAPLAGGVIEYDLELTADPPENTDGALIIGDALRTGTGLAGVRPASTRDEEVGIDLDDVELDVTFGVALSGDLAALAADDADSRADRFYLRAGNDAGPVLRIGDVSAGPTDDDPDMTAQVGFLGVDATLEGFTLADSGDGDAITVHLSEPAADADAGTNTIGVEGAHVLRHVASNPGAHSTAAFALTSGGTVSVQPAGSLDDLIDGDVEAPLRTITVGWGDAGVIPGARPTVTADDAFVTDLTPFDVSPTVAGFAGTGTVHDDTEVPEANRQDDEQQFTTPIAPDTVLADPEQDFTTAFGFPVTPSSVLEKGQDAAEESQVAGTLFNITTGASCQLFEVVTSTSLRCVDGLIGGVERDDAGVTVIDSQGQAVPDNSWHVGDRYEVKGDATTLGRILVEGAGDLTNDIDQHPSLDTELALLGVPVRDLVPQLARLLDDSLVPILDRIGEAGPPGAPLEDPDAGEAPISTLQELATALTEAGVDHSLTVEDQANPLHPDAQIPHLVLRLGSIEHEAPLPLTGVRADLAGRALRLGVPEPPGPAEGSATEAPGTPAPPAADISSSVQLDLGVPLHAEVAAQRLLVLPTTGVTAASLSFSAEDLDLSGTFGPLAVAAGVDAKLAGLADNASGTHTAPSGTISGFPEVTGTATGGSSSSVQDTVAGFLAAGVVAGGTLRRTADDSCTVATVTETTLTCDGTLSGTFADGDGYSYEPNASAKHFETDAVPAEVVDGDTAVTATGSCVIASVNNGVVTCDELATGDFRTGQAFEVESPTVVVHGVDQLGDSYGAGDQLVNATRDEARCTISSISATAITCAQALSEGERWRNGDTWVIEKGATGTVLVDDDVAFDTLGIEGGTVENLTDAFTCAITATEGNTATCGTAPTDGVRNRWLAEDRYEITGVAAAQLDAAFSLLSDSTDPVLLDGASESFDGLSAEAFIDTLDPDVTGPDAPNRCFGPDDFAGGDACFRLSLLHDGDGDGPDEDDAFLGVAEWYADVDGGSAVSDVSSAALSAAEDAEIAVPEIATATVFLADLLGAQLDGYNVPTEGAADVAWDPDSTLLPLVGADLTAAGGHDEDRSVEDAIAALGAALAGLEDVGVEAVDTGIELATQVDALLADDALSSIDVTPVGSATVRCVTDGTTGDCGEESLTLEDDVQVSVSVGRNLTTAGVAPDKGCIASCGTAETSSVPFDSGLPGLSFTSDASLSSQYAWKLDLTFGISRTRGPYLLTSGGDEFTLGAGVSIPGGTNDCQSSKPTYDGIPSNTPAEQANPEQFSDERCFDAKLGLLEATVFDGEAPLTGTEAHDASTDWSDVKTEETRLVLQTKVDLQGPGGSDRLDLIDLLEDDHESSTQVDADANVDLWFVTHKDLPGGNIPRVMGGLHFAFDQAHQLTCEQIADDVMELEEGDERSTFIEGCGGAATETTYPIVGDIEYRDMVLDLKSFFDDFLGPWVADVGGVIGTLRPVADGLLTPIPGISQLAELTGQQPVTAFSLMQEISGNELTLIYNLLEFLQFADVVANGSAETVNDDDGIIGIGGATQIDDYGFPTGLTSEGGFKYDGPDARGSGPCGDQLPTIGGHRGGTQKRFKPKDCKKSSTDYGKGGQASKLRVDASLTGFSAGRDSEKVKQLKDCPRDRCTGKELARTVSKNSKVELGAPGLWFPFLADANEIFGMLTGDKDAQLVRLDLGTLEASVGLSIGFGPFMAGPVPIEIGIGGSISASMRTMVGLDTLGLRTTGKLLDGFFIEDLDPLNGYDVYEIQVVFTISVYAAVSLRVVKAGLEGEIEIGIGANLQDPDDDGRVRPDELAMYGGDWWCAFALEGYLSFVARIFVELDFKLWSKRWAYPLFRHSETLFTIECEPDPPRLATEIDADNKEGIQAALSTAAGRKIPLAAGDLVLNVGPRSGDRNVDEDETNEAVTIRQMEPEGAGDVACPPWFDVDGDGDPRGEGCPPVPPCPGSATDVCTGVLVDGFGMSQEFRVGKDARIVAVTTSSGDDDADSIQLLAGSDPSGAGTIPFTIDSEIHLGPDKDRFGGGEGVDVVYGGSGRDTLEGGAGDDVLHGEAGADSLKGEIGGDHLDGGDDTDRMAGGPGADLLLGGAGEDSLTGGPGLTPSLARRILETKFPDDSTAELDARVARVADGGDALVGGAGDDEITGQIGDDLLVGDDLDGYTGESTRDALLLGSLSAEARAALVGGLCGATTGTGGHDRIEGATGDDTIIGGPGHDDLMGGRGDDTICGLAGADLVQGDDQNPNLPAGDDDLRGGAGDDRLLGRGGNDELHGGTGSDLLEGGAGDDRLIGGSGSDVAIGDDGYDIILGDGGTIADGKRTDDPVTRVALDAEPTVEEPGSVRCAVTVTVIDGLVDLDGDGTVGSSDDGFVDGIPVFDGQLNIDRRTTVANEANAAKEAEEAEASPEEGSAQEVFVPEDPEVTVDALDNGIIGDLIVTGGALDIDGDGTPGGGDDGTAPLIAHMGSGDADCLLGGDGRDGLFGGQGDDYLLGDRGMDIVHGNGGADVARGGSENDTISGGAGDDEVYGDADDDTLTGDDDDDQLFGGNGDDHIEGNGGSDEAHGEGGADVVIGGTSVAGRADGDDVLYGNAGADLLIGDNGTGSNDGTPTWQDLDPFDQPADGAAPDPALYGIDTIDGGTGGDVIAGGGDDDVLAGDGPGIAAGLAGPDHIEGNAGADTIDGDQGDDRLIGGSSTAGISDGEDVIGGGSGADVIVGDNAVLQREAGATLVALHDLAISGEVAPAERLAGDDRIWGGDRPGSGASIGVDRADRVYGQSGDDTIHGQGGDDHLEGNSGADTVAGDVGDDTLIGGSSADEGGIDPPEPAADAATTAGEVDADPGHGTGRLTIDGAPRVLDQVIDGERPHPSGDGDIGDTLSGGTGRDHILGDNARALLRGDGVDVVLANVPFAVLEPRPATDLAGGDEISGGGDDDVIYGQSGDDTISADDGDDVVEGGAGSDTIAGGAGDDDLVGGSGRDSGTETDDGWAERELAGVVDADDTIDGGAGADLIAGDNAKTWRVTVDDRIAHLVEIHDVPFLPVTETAPAPHPHVAGGDTVHGGADTDELYGQSGADTIDGGTADDRIEGGDGADTIAGGDGDDDIAGGSGHDDGGDAGALRLLASVGDGEDTITGDGGSDRIAGDNASHTRSDGLRRTHLHDVPFTDASTVAPEPGVAAGDTIWGDSLGASTGASDVVWGQSGDDTIAGGPGDDDLQGNEGSDTIQGDAGGDDIVGGSSHDQGGADGADRDFPGVRDAAVDRAGLAIGDVLWGDAPSSASPGDLADVIVGDNARIRRTAIADPNRPDVPVRTVELFDVTVVGGHQADPATAGPDQLHGQAGHDVLAGQGGDDELHGGDGDDHLEGNAGADAIHGGADRDDIIGGSSVNPGGERGSILGAGHFPEGTDVADGGDAIHGDGSSGLEGDNSPDPLAHAAGGDDAIVADNGRIDRVTGADGVWTAHEDPYGSLVRRTVLVASRAELAGAWGNDSVWAGEGHDEVHGQLGDDVVHGGDGDDAVMGDLGRYTLEVIREQDPRTGRISADSDFIHEIVYRPYTLHRLADLFAATEAGGMDVITGGGGNDAVHAGPGADVVNGHGDIPRTEGDDTSDRDAVTAIHAACDEDLDQVVPAFQAAGAVGQLRCDEDLLFGGDGDDRLWGGPSHDLLFGGHGNDHLDVVYAGFDPLAGNPDVDFRGVDHIFGGWGQDALQADVSAPNPNGLDKLIDATGAYNAYFVCEGAYGGNSVVRVLSPTMVTFLERTAGAAGGFDVTNEASSGYRDLANIYKPDIKHNQAPVHPETPGNFTCGDPAPDESASEEPAAASTPEPEEPSGDGGPADDPAAAEASGSEVAPSTSSTDASDPGQGA